MSIRVLLTNIRYDGNGNTCLFFCHHWGGRIALGDATRRVGRPRKKRHRWRSDHRCINPCSVKKEARYETRKKNTGRGKKLGQWKELRDLFIFFRYTFFHPSSNVFLQIQRMHQGWVCPNAAISWAMFSDWFLDNDFMCPNKRSSKTPNFSDYFPDVSMIFSMCFVQFLKHRAWAISPSQDFIICAALVVLLFGPRSVEIAMIGLWMLAQYGT